MENLTDNLTDERKKVKHLFMTYRNGIVADSLRSAGMPYGVIFGLQLPQLRRIAADLKEELGESDLYRLACALHEERNVRESRILAMAIMPPEALTESEAETWISDIITREEADLLPFLLLRNTDLIPSLLEKKSGFDNISSDLREYAREALQRFQA